MSADFTLDAAALKAGARLFGGPCDFAAGATMPSLMPEEGPPEVAFSGRSNVGKSSLVNALTGRKSLARASNTPGRTQQINFFDLGGAAYLVDLPGYGHAVASKESIRAWTGLIRAYLRHRRVLKRVCVLVDARHGFKDSDREMMQELAEAGVGCLVVLTKADKVKPPALAARIAAMEEELRFCPSAYPKIYATSADKGAGIPELRAFLAWEMGRGG